MRSLIVRAILFICSVGLVISIRIIPIQAAATGSFYWEKIDVNLELVESGDLLVTETQKYIITDIYTDQVNYDIEISKSVQVRDIAVTENNQPVANLQISESDGKQHLKWGGLTSKFYSSEGYTSVLKYRVVGGLEVADPQTKFKWTAPSKATQVTLHLPAKLAGTAKNFTTTGLAVDTKIINPTIIQFVAKEPINAQSKLAVIGQFPTNLLPLSQPQPQSLLANLFNWILTIIFFLIFLSSTGSSSDY